MEIEFHCKLFFDQKKIWPVDGLLIHVSKSVLREQPCSRVQSYTDFQEVSSPWLYRGQMKLSASVGIHFNGWPQSLTLCLHSLACNLCWCLELNSSLPFPFRYVLAFHRSPFSSLMWLTLDCGIPPIFVSSLILLYFISQALLEFSYQRIRDRSGDIPSVRKNSNRTGLKGVGLLYVALKITARF